MPIITLDLPDEVAVRLLALSEVERNEITTKALLNEWEENEAALPPLSQADFEAIREGLEQANAGQGRDAEAFLAELSLQFKHLVCISHSSYSSTSAHLYF